MTRWRWSRVNAVASAADDTPTTLRLTAAIPSYQAPSVPPPGGAAYGAVNNAANDLGYRGGQVVFRNLTAPNGNSGLTAGWDAFYKNPDNGYFQPAAQTWPYTCANGHVSYSDAAGTAPIVCRVCANTTMTEVPGRHFFCPICGQEFAAAGTCPFDGANVDATSNLIPLPDAVREEHLVAEEYDPFDVQVSVSRQVELAQTAPDLAIGRTAPGVQALRPDTTQDSPLARHRAFPGDVSSLPRFPYDPSDAKVLLRNEGNVALSPRLSGAHERSDSDSSDSPADRGLDHYLRIDVDSTSFSYGRKAQSGPLTRDTFLPLFHEGGTTPAAGSIFEASLPAEVEWPTYAQTVGAPAGEDRTFGFLTAGNYFRRSVVKPVPMGQPVGTYSGGQLQYLDLDGDGHFDFQYTEDNGASWNDATTADRGYNPSTDRPIEPLVGVVRGEARVFETRLPQNDYYARDSDPVVLPSTTAGQMQVVWSTNRASTGTATAVGSAAPAGTDPTDLPTSDSPSNLVYTTTRGLTGGAVGRVVPASTRGRRAGRAPLCRPTPSPPTAPASPTASPP